VSPGLVSKAISARSRKGAHGARRLSGGNRTRMHVRSTDKKRLSVTFVGHQGCGKSTILGQILRLLGIVDPVRAKKIDAAATQNSCRPARFAMVCLRLFLHLMYHACDFTCLHSALKIEDISINISEERNEIELDKELSGLPPNPHRTFRHVHFHMDSRPDRAPDMKGPWEPAVSTVCLPPHHALPDPSPFALAQPCPGGLALGPRLQQFTQANYTAQHIALANTYIVLLVSQHAGTGENLPNTPNENCLAYCTR
jgi:energy-coupling factor transporter ATP-binding protein EcfA2